MKHKKENHSKISSLKSLAWMIALSSLLIGCKNDEIKKEDVPELITKATLTFTPVAGGNTIEVTATDPDGEGVQDIIVDGPINLTIGVTYILKLSLINELADPADPEYNITDEVTEEGDEHMFFFSWTNDVFSNPSGNGNIDNRNDPVNYTGGSDSKDINGRPLGLTTTWITVASDASGSFRVLLKHQPDLKSDTSDSNTGETDLDITFTINVQ